MTDPVTTVRGMATVMRDVEEAVEFIDEELKPFPH